uniref:Core-binding (CB) domain-containing protein n=1 Tax=uncultured prokaryote TaxID=198431 RepID=A0A0H5QMR6_9ZZZZ|nr:hypothetical protein [uncultured prokaryote]
MRNKTPGLKQQARNILQSKLSIGESKHFDKQFGDTSNKIYSWGTYRSYHDAVNHFCDYLKENHSDVKNFEDGKQYINEYLQSRMDKGLSPYTVKLDANALGKVYEMSTKDMVQTNSRYRENITRSREEVTRDRHFSVEKNKELVNFCQCTGLRRSELETLKPNQLIYNHDLSRYELSIKGKGGRERIAPIIGSQEQVKMVVERIERTPDDEKVWGKVHSACDVHSYRSEYATRYYESIARPIDELRAIKNTEGTYKVSSEIYACRKDLKGVYYDKKAMLEVSQALGHNRISVIAEHYLRGGE